MLKAIFLTYLNTDFTYSYVRSKFGYNPDEFLIFAPNRQNPKYLSEKLRGRYSLILDGVIEIFRIDDKERTKAGGYEVYCYKYSREDRKYFLQYYYL